ncbi:hypothetical protein HG535_0F00770 [Zygotorulaspora mrakii]|uniref:Uncharacterized protein n=1 Tax=Zygotorulaspora mrakii TaxID=42260 RepID=A0A7H9B4V0_ZYGMR|nr:uncharacterized protein HG535_0F00770 [Zygotorulaspora mrakii]QLG73567.1 hypothetical protein HG535_0F00770 [Zygotorulaspora mrakii]
MKLTGKEIRICSLLLLDTVFFVLEITIGYMSHSLALIADSFHMLNDIISLLVALWAVNVAKIRSPDATYTYGWKRAEILGALINAVFLIALCFTILIEAIQRLISPPVIENPKLVLIVGFAGLVSNFVGLFLFHDHGSSHGHGHGHSHGGGSTAHADEEAAEHHSHTHNVYTSSELEQNESDISIDHSNDNIRDVWPQSVVERMSNEHTGLLKKNDHTHATEETSTDDKKAKKGPKSLNMHGVFLHVLGDALGNVGVIIAALFIWKTNYSWRFYSDPLVSLIITVIIFSSALPLSRQCSRILLQATPSTISAEKVQKEILAVSGVKSVHDFHIWNLTESFYIASLHVKIDCLPSQFTTVAKGIRNILHNHGIHSATVQPEFASKDVSLDTSKRFSLLAGSGPIHNESPDDLTEQEGSTPTPGYGSTISDGNCLVDQAANCNADDCLPK